MRQDFEAVFCQRSARSLDDPSNLPGILQKDEGRQFFYLVNVQKIGIGFFSVEPEKVDLIAGKAQLVHDRQEGRDLFMTVSAPGTEINGYLNLTKVTAMLLQELKVFGF